ncbi:MAG TPA: hypothetical protein DCP63_09235, partial [Bacteroidetes bacterium]|nr:hypothetical protein [Bacteroidota bacterium]
MKNAQMGFVFPAVVLFLFLGCSKNASDQSNDVALTKEIPEHTAAGVVWSYPSRWKKEGPR